MIPDETERRIALYFEGNLLIEQVRPTKQPERCPSVLRLPEDIVLLERHFARSQIVSFVVRIYKGPSAKKKGKAYDPESIPSIYARMGMSRRASNADSHRYWKVKHLLHPDVIQAIEDGRIRIYSAIAYFTPMTHVEQLAALTRYAEQIDEAVRPSRPNARRQVSTAIGVIHKPRVRRYMAQHSTEALERLACTTDGLEDRVTPEHVPFDVKLEWQRLLDESIRRLNRIRRRLVASMNRKETRP